MFITRFNTRLLLGLALCAPAMPLCAAMPLVSIALARGYSNNIPLYHNGSALILYTLTNNGTSSLSFEIRTNPKNIGGGGGSGGDSGNVTITVPATANSCATTQTLAPQSSCTLGLLANANMLASAGASELLISPQVTVNPFWKFTSPEPLDVSISSADAPVTLSSKGLALSVKNTTLNAALTGTPRQIKITNTSATTANNVRYVISPALPDDASIAPSTCGNIAAGATCTLTITPGETPVSSTLFTISSNASALSLPLDILSYGSVYQSGYVFSIDDNITPITESVGGKVAALKNQAPFWPLGRIWASNGITTCTYPRDIENIDINAFAPCTDYTALPGINETSTTAAGDACNGNKDGACDTNVIVNYFDNLNIDRDLYAAGLCKATIGDFDDWYLPSVCETGYWSPAPRTPTVNSFCGSQATPLIQNMKSNLAELGVGNLLGILWSSTQYSNANGTLGNAWATYYYPRFYYQTHDGKENTSGVRCVRALTQPATV